MNISTKISVWDYIVSTKLRIDKFHSSWTAKHNEFDDGFDKFISIYIGYNSLYEATTRLFLLEGKISYDDYRTKYQKNEIERAANIMVQLLKTKATSIMSAAIIMEEIPEIERIIKEPNYYFDFRPLDQGLFQKLASEVLPTSNFPNKSLEQIFESSNDLILLNALKSEDPSQRLEALLKLLYKVRCNIFHGNKIYQYDMSQRVKRYANILYLIYDESYKEWNKLSENLKIKYDS